MGDVYTMPPSLPFARVLAKGLLARMKRNGNHPEALSQMRILLPTRRACRTLQDAFLRESDGRALLLPKLQPIGEADSEELLLSIPDASLAQDFVKIPPALPEMRRQILLAGFIEEHQEMSKIQALKLSKALCGFLDEIYTEGLDLTDLENLVPDNFAEHWQITLDFLSIFKKQWPQKLQDMGMIEAVQRHNILLDMWAKIWGDNPPKDHIIAAGMTGTIPAAAAFLRIIKDLQNSEIILPGVDVHMDEMSWDFITQSHPQYGLYRLLSGLELAPKDVQIWPDCAQSDIQINIDKEKILSQAMRPAATTLSWRDLDNHFIPDPKCLTSLTRIDAASAQEEALCVSLIMREALEVVGQTVKFITSDRHLARRVTQILHRWDIAVDDSAGENILSTSRGGFIMHVLAAACDPSNPVALLSLFKNRWFGDTHTDGLRQDVRHLDKSLRGIATPVLLAEQAEKHPFMAHALSVLNSVQEQDILSLKSWVKVHLEAAEILAQTKEKSGTQRLWSGEEGDALSTFFADLMLHGDVTKKYSLFEYQEILDVLGAGVMVRPRYGTHARLAILGTMESRLNDADIIIMGGLNEGHWPPAPNADPWLSRPMREKIGLPTPEQRIGFTAHDFTQHFCAPRVFLTRAQKQDGTMTIPARWLTRFETVLSALNLKQDLSRGQKYISWARAVDAWDGTVSPVSRPAPKPAVKDRISKISVTGIEAWMRDPYSVYAKYILNLRELDPLDKKPDAALRGSIIHEMLHVYIGAHMNDWPHSIEDVAEEMKACAVRAAQKVGFEKPHALEWWPRVNALIDWFATAEGAWRVVGNIPNQLEHEGSVDIAGVTVTAKADRLEKLADGSIGIIDYKTGKVQNVADAKRGYLPQLPLEALIARDGGFKDIPANDVGYIGFWQLIGDIKTLALYTEIKPDKDESFDELIEKTRAGITRLITTFQDEDVPFLSLPILEKMPLYRDYDYLARFKEWADEDSDGGSA